MMSIQSSCNSSSSLASCKLEKDEWDEHFQVKPPSGTNHQQPGRHLSIDTRFSELSLESSSLFAESERQPLPLFRSVTYDSLSRNKTMPGQVVVQKNNFYIKSPFKQGPEKIVKGPVLRVDPGYDLKQRTIASVMRVKKQLQHESRTRYSRVLCSQLQKGNLKTLGRPMTASGPQVRSCQGIVAGFRTSHGFATTRTENSFIEDGKFPHINLSQMNLPHWASTKPESNPASSIHRTSIASSEDRSHIVSDKGFSRC